MSDSCSITVSGMTCAACSSRVQRTLQQTPGVRDASVNLMTGTATVAFDPPAVTPGSLVDVIRETGYGAELPPPDASAGELFEAQDAERAAEVADLGRKFGVSLVAGDRRDGALDARDDGGRTGAGALGAPRAHASRGAVGRAGTSTPARGPRSGTTAPT